jgi:hypothetical protein
MFKNQAEAKKITTPYNWASISNMLKNNTGQELDYDSFKSMVDANPNIENLFHSFDDRGITFIKPAADKTAVAAKKEKAQAGINASAKRAASKIVG